MAPTNGDSKLLIPMKLDAFVLNQVACSGDSAQAKIAPITQPNYTYLRLNPQDSYISNDVLDHVDLHTTTPSNNNSRITDLGSGKLHQNRIGVYLHWMLPRPYRSGTTADESSPPLDDFSASAPQYPKTPNRWLIIRTLDPSAPTTQPQGTSIEGVKVWIVDSDRMRTIDELDDGVDVQVDVSPFISSDVTDVSGKGISIDQQAVVFIGDKVDAASWEEMGDQYSRVDLSILNSSNQLFPDYQPHCSNVFSIIDDFEYVIPGPTPESPTTTGNLQGASASYDVIGWNAAETDDLLWLDPGSGTDVTRGARLAALNMVIQSQGDQPDAVKQWLNSTDPARSLCHGAIYNVGWTAGSSGASEMSNPVRESTQPFNVPADDFSADLQVKQSVAVGTTPMDSLLAYVGAGGNNSTLVNLIEKLQVYLRAQDDSASGLQAATDEVQNFNFARSSGGTRYHFPNIAGLTNDNPSPQDRFNLEDLNKTQELLDSSTRYSAQLQWELFACWWKFISDVDNGSSDVQTRYQKEKDSILGQLNNASNVNSEQVGLVNSFLSKLPTGLQAGVHCEFSQPKDPTLLVSGINNAWPYDFLNSLETRLDAQVITPPAPEPNVLQDFFINKLPPDLQDAAGALVQEFLTIAPDINTPATSGQFPPLYHDQGDPNTNPSVTSPWRDRWENTQPWFPLFIEWEAQYFHIPFEDWLFDFETVREGGNAQVRYGVKVDLTSMTEQGGQATPGGEKQIPSSPPAPSSPDIRTLSGRILILPQASFSLKAQIDRLFASMAPAELDEIICVQQQTELTNNLWQLSFLSAPLTGFTDHLLTLAHGTHIKPNSRSPGGVPTPLPDAVTAAANIGFTSDQIQQIGQETHLTPYGSLVRFDDRTTPAFKPVTHGQFRMTKLNIIDKFGQAVHAIDPTYLGPSPLYPCISDYFEPGLTAQGEANVVDPTNSTGGACEFMQIPLQINQPARLNRCFVTHDESSTSGEAYWRPTEEWESPIWGWIIINYVDYGIQIFTSDGTFYREVRLSNPDAPTPPTVSTKWLPFGPPSNPQKTGQLDALISKLTESGGVYAQSFISSLNAAVDSTATPPSTYSQYVSSLVGKPLALANAGWSIELASCPKTEQSSLDPAATNPSRQLLPDEQHDLVYTFPVKFGDKDRLNDGLIGYFETSAPPLAQGSELNLSAFYTYFSSPPSSSSPSQSPTPTLSTDSFEVIPITPSNFPSLPVTWVDPTAPATSSADTYAAARYSNLSVFGLVFDPFQSVNAYTSILPISSLTLPRWTWESALQKMTAFFHLGPVMLTADVPAFSKSNQLQADYDFSADNDPTVKGSAVGMPALATAEWDWLQPYMDDEGKPDAFMALNLSKEEGGGRPKLETGPYTAVEGYLQMKQPIVQGQDSSS